MGRYYYRNSNGEQAGPVDESMLQIHGVRPDTMIWKRGMREWLPAAEVLGPNFFTQREYEGRRTDGYTSPNGGSRQSDHPHQDSERTQFDHNPGFPPPPFPHQTPSTPTSNPVSGSSTPPKPFQPTPPYQGQGNPPMPPKKPDTTQQERPNNYLVWSILVGILCGLLPLGCFAIYFASIVNKDWDNGLHEKAIEDAKKAKIFLFIQLGLGFIGIIIGIILMIGALSGTAYEPETEYYYYYQ